MTLAPQSASWRTPVGPARTRVRSRTVKRERAVEARGKGICCDVKAGPGYAGAAGGADHLGYAANCLGKAWGTRNRPQPGLPPAGPSIDFVRELAQDAQEAVAAVADDGIELALVLARASRELPQQLLAAPGE